MAGDLDPIRGRLLVATPDLEDPNFATTVVLLLEHDAEGTVGIILNRPSPLPLHEALQDEEDAQLSALATAPAQVFVGGPVRPNAVVALARVPEVRDPERWQQVLGDIGVVDVGEGDLADLGTVADLRVFAGYAGWGEGQLEGEIAGGSWFVVEARGEDCFAADPGLLWHAVLQRQGGVFTTATDDPSRN